MTAPHFLSLKSQNCDPTCTSPATGRSGTDSGPGNTTRQILTIHTVTHMANVAPVPTLSISMLKHGADALRCLPMRMCCSRRQLQQPRRCPWGIRGRDYTTSQERPKEHVHEEVSHFFSNLHSGAVGRCPGRPAARRCGAPPLRRSPACVRRAQASRAVVSGRSGGGRAAVVMDGSDGFKVKPMAGCQGLPWQ